MNNNAFANNAFADLFKNDMFKNSADMFKPNLDFNQAFSSQRRNVEAVTEVCQVGAEFAQESFRASTETLRSNVETVLKNSKDVFSGSSPEASLAKQADLIRSIYENTLSSMREIAEMATKCGFEAFEVVNRRTSETMNEISKPAHKAAAHSKKK